MALLNKVDAPALHNVHHQELIARTQNSVQVLVEPVAHVAQSFLRTRDSRCVVVAVPHSPSMRYARKNLDKVIDLQFCMPFKSGTWNLDTIVSM